MTLERILEAVITVTGITLDDLKKRGSVTEEVTDAKLLYYEIGRRNGFVYRQIGELVDRKHSSVMTSLKNHHFTKSFKKSLEEVLDILGVEDDVEPETKPLWDENFRIVDISSKHFGSCFMGLDNDEIVASGCRPKVINAMLDRRS